MSLVLWTEHQGWDHSFWMEASFLYLTAKIIVTLHAERVPNSVSRWRTAWWLTVSQQTRQSHPSRESNSGLYTSLCLQMQMCGRNSALLARLDIRCSHRVHQCFHCSSSNQMYLPLSSDHHSNRSVPLTTQLWLARVSSSLIWGAKELKYFG